MIKSLLIIAIAIKVFCADLVLNNTPIQVYFSPKGGIANAIVKEINSAKSEVLVQAYGLTSAPILKALIDAHKRGVKVVAIVDKSNIKNKATPVTNVVQNGVEVLVDDKHKIAHNKIIIIDRQIVITGSYNFTKSAEFDNAENLLILDNKELANIYLQNFAAHREHSAQPQ